MTFKKRKFTTRRSIPTEYKGIAFDSTTEANYFKHLEQDKTVQDIKLQPVFQIIEPYKVVCKSCEGSGRIMNIRTSNLNKCRRCAGNGLKTKAGAIYTADFKVTYLNGSSEVIDVKGGLVERDFSLRKKLLESKSGQEVVVVRYKGKKWVRE